MKVLRWIWNIPTLLLIGCVRLYQLAVSPILQALGTQCRFVPSCSEYFIHAVRKYGAISGTLRGLWRICRCNPYCKGGYDPP